MTSWRWSTYASEAFAYNAFTAISGYSRIPPRLVSAFTNVADPQGDAVKVLDFGCGTGRLSKAIFDAVPNAVITGMEPCDQMGNRAVKRFAANDNFSSRFNLVRAPYEHRALPFPQESFDVVAATGVFDHIEIDDDVMRDFMAVVKPGGHLAFSYERKPSWALGGPISNVSDVFIKHKDDYVAEAVKAAGGEIKHQSDMTGYVIPRYARFGLMVAQKPA